MGLGLWTWVFGYPRFEHYVETLDMGILNRFCADNSIDADMFESWLLDRCIVAYSEPALESYYREYLAEQGGLSVPLRTSKMEHLGYIAELLKKGNR